MKFLFIVIAIFGVLILNFTSVDYTVSRWTLALTGHEGNMSIGGQFLAGLIPIWIPAAMITYGVAPAYSEARSAAAFVPTTP